MNADARPNVSLSRLLPYVVLLILGLLIFALSFAADRFALERSALSGGVGASPGVDAIFVKQGAWWQLLLGAMSTAMITVSLFELVKTLLQYLIWMSSRRRRLNSFFGEGAVENSAAAEVVVQSDQLSVVLKGLLDSDPILEKIPSNRLYKARSWMNQFDAEGGRQIIKLFRDEGLAPPTLTSVERDRKSKPALIPFKILLGLGFTEQAHALVKGNFKNWLRIVVTEKGDAISVRKSLLPGDWESRLESDGSAPAEFVTLWPRQWNLSAWLAESEQVRDYAVILRHSGEVGGGAEPCVYFWLAGFTERGTAAAGRYLAENWEALHNRFVRKSIIRSFLRLFGAPLRFYGDGDFMVMIEGPSHDKSTFERWSEIHGFEITPLKLVDKKVDTVWADRAAAGH